MQSLLSYVDPSTLTLLEEFDMSDILDALNNLTNITIVLNWGGDAGSTIPEIPQELVE